MVGVFGNSQKVSVYTLFSVSGDLWGVGLAGKQQLGEGRTGDESAPQTPAVWWGVPEPLLPFPGVLQKPCVFVFCRTS